MSSIGLTHQQFQSLLATLSPQIIQDLVTLQTPYSEEDYLNSKEVKGFLDIFTSILDTVLHLEKSYEHEGITRDNVKQFIAHFNEWLTPSYESASVRTCTVGDEIRRILNHMAYSMRTW
jgi:hypothetical protein